MGFYKNLMIDLMNEQRHGFEEDETAEEEDLDDFFGNAQADEPVIHQPVWLSLTT